MRLAFFSILTFTLPWGSALAVDSQWLGFQKLYSFSTEFPKPVDGVKKITTIIINPHTRRPLFDIDFAAMDSSNTLRSWFYDAYFRRKQHLEDTRKTTPRGYTQGLQLDLQEQRSAPKALALIFAGEHLSPETLITGLEFTQPDYDPKLILDHERQMGIEPEPFPTEVSLEETLLKPNAQDGTFEIRDPSVTPRTQPQVTGLITEFNKLWVNPKFNSRIWSFVLRERLETSQAGDSSFSPTYRRVPREYPEAAFKQLPNSVQNEARRWSAEMKGVPLVYATSTRFRLKVAKGVMERFHLQTSPFRPVREIKWIPLEDLPPRERARVSKNREVSTVLECTRREYLEHLIGALKRTGLSELLVRSKTSDIPIKSVLRQMGARYRHKNGEPVIPARKAHRRLEQRRLLKRK